MEVEAADTRRRDDVRVDHDERVDVEQKVDATLAELVGEARRSGRAR